MRYRRFWIKGDREEIFGTIMKWAKASRIEYIRSELDPRITLVTKRKGVSIQMLEFMFGGFSKKPSGIPFIDILLFDHGNKLIEVVFRVIEGFEEEADIAQEMLLEFYPLERKES